MTYILAIDQGTTSSRAILFDKDMRPVQSCQQEFPQYFPQSGWVEHDAQEIWASVQAVVGGVMAQAGCTAKDIAAIGITNQRETTLVWDRNTGAPIHKAIVWQDRRTSAFCDRLRAEGHEAEITQKTGLLLDPYFSATKLHWLLTHIEGAAERAARGELLFGTMDSYLIWKLTEGRAHVTDATNAARTMLYDIRQGCWDAQICALMQVPPAMLPDVRDCASEFGTTTLFGADIPILGVAGDQQAATIGQACFEPGMLKSTYGTGCFALLNTGDTLVTSKNRMLGTLPISWAASRPMPWKAQSLSPGRWCNGCATGSGLFPRRMKLLTWPPPPTPPNRCILCRRLPGSARPIGTPTVAARSSD